MIKPWSRIRSRIEQSFRVFSIRTDTVISPRTGREHEFYIIESRDWINVIPLTHDDRVVMIRQYRHGSEEVTLEIPGGLLDSGDTPEKAAARELLEETGYEAEELVKIGMISPNPAIFSNRCYTFMARNIRRVGDPMPDPTEDIEVVLIALSDIPGLIRSGEINHALVIAAFSLFFCQKGEA
jgi:8-oxo-dGTP pyrophosphatase MutT (NUDIX family)